MIENSNIVVARLRRFTYSCWKILPKMIQNKVLKPLIIGFSVVVLCYILFVDLFFYKWVEQQPKETVRLIQRGYGFAMLWISILCFYSLYRKLAKKEAPIQH